MNFAKVLKGARRFFACLLSAAVIATVMQGTVWPILTAKADGTQGSWGDSANIDTGWYDQHTSDTTFTITTAQQLAGLSQLVNNGDAKSSNTPVNFSGKTVKLCADIDLSAHIWVPIGNISNYFQGTFDGQCYTISGMTIGSASSPDTGYTYVGFFGYADQAVTINNVKLSNIAVYTNKSGDSGDCNIGGLFGQLSTGSANRCSVTGTINVKNASYAGGLAGATGNWAKLKDCFSTVSISVDSKDTTVGGLVGDMDEGGINNCYAAVSVSVSGNATQVGLVGTRKFGGIYTSFYESTDIVQTHEGEATPKTTEDMKKAATYAGWDAHVWSIADGSYPSLNTPVRNTAIGGVTAPAPGVVPATSVTETSEYTGTVSWSPAVTGEGFLPYTHYTAIITLTLKAGYTLSNVTLTAAGASSVTSGSSYGVINVEYPEITNGWSDSSDSVDTSWYDNHTGDAPYSISTAAQLAGLAKLVNNGNDFSGKTVNLENSIDLSGHDWVPIGGCFNNSDLKSFKGTFNGQGNTISNMTIGSASYPADYQYVGLFGNISMGSLKDTCLTGVSIHSTRSPLIKFNYVGSLTGYSSSSSVDGCSAYGNILINGTTQALDAGGLVGHCDADSSVSNCHASVDVSLPITYDSTYNYVGGLIGAYYGLNEVSDNSKITNCFCAGGNVTASGSGLLYVGGFVGYDNGNITNCFCAGGNVTATSRQLPYAGGFVGYARDNLNKKITQCYSASGAVSATGGSTSAAGGFAGTSYGKPQSNNCYFDSATTGLTADADGDGATAVANDSDLKGTAAQTTLAGFAFTGDSPVWAVTAGGYPHLKSMERTLSFDSAGGGAVAAITFMPGDVVSAPAAPSKSGSSFAGWYTDGGKAFDFSKPQTQSQTLLAHWTAIPPYIPPAPTTAPVTITGTVSGDGSTTATIPVSATNASSVSNVTVKLSGSTVTAPASVLSSALGSGNSLTLMQTTPDTGLQAKISAAAASAGVFPEFVINFSLVATDAAGSVTAVHSLSDNVTVTVGLTDAQLAAIGSDASKAKIYYYDELTGKLTDMNAVFDLNSKTATFTTNHFSSYVLTVPDKTPPVVTGVDNDSIYNTDKTIIFNKGTATLDGSAFTSGSAVSAEGKHTLIVTDAAGNVTTVIFTTDKTAPAVTGVKNGGIYKTSKKITFSDGAATLDGSAFTSGITVSADGKHTLAVTDAAGNRTTVTFTIDKIAPKIAVRRVKGGMIVTATDKNLLSKNVTLNGKKLVWAKNGRFTRNGKYLIMATDKAGNKTVKKFKI